MAKWGEIKCPRCEELEAKLNYSVGEWEDYEKIIKQLQAEWLVNRVAIMRLEAKLAKAVEALEAIVVDDTWGLDHDVYMICRTTLAELTGGKDE